jgi:site-specific DNA-methyltransferase (adenine-specific)
MKVINNIWSYTVGLNNSTKDKIAFKHPAVFPEKLAEDHILSWTNEEDLVFDPFTGSGTTLKMAMLNNRKFLGFEVSDEYIEIAQERLTQYAKEGYCYCGNELIWQNDSEEGHFYTCSECDNEVLKDL